MDIVKYVTVASSGSIAVMARSRSSSFGIAPGTVEPRDCSGRASALRVDSNFITAVPFGTAFPCPLGLGQHPLHLCVEGACAHTFRTVLVQPGGLNFHVFPELGGLPGRKSRIVSAERRFQWARTPP